MVDSISANWSPTHFLGPPPNGKKAKSDIIWPQLRYNINKHLYYWCNRNTVTEEEEEEGRKVPRLDTMLQDFGMDQIHSILQCLHCPFSLKTFPVQIRPDYPKSRETCEDYIPSNLIDSKNWNHTQISITFWRMKNTYRNKNICASWDCISTFIAFKASYIERRNGNLVILWTKDELMYINVCRNRDFRTKMHFSTQKYVNSSIYINTTNVSVNFISHLCLKGNLPGKVSDFRERLISNGGCGYKRRVSTTISRKYLKAFIRRCWWKSTEQKTILKDAKRNQSSNRSKYLRGFMTYSSFLSDSKVIICSEESTESISAWAFFILEGCCKWKAIIHHRQKMFKFIYEELHTYSLI